MTSYILSKCGTSLHCGWACDFSVVQLDQMTSGNGHKRVPFLCSARSNDLLNSEQKWVFSLPWVSVCVFRCAQTCCFKVLEWTATKSRCLHLFCFSLCFFSNQLLNVSDDDVFILVNFFSLCYCTLHLVSVEFNFYFRSKHLFWWKTKKNER